MHLELSDIATISGIVAAVTIIVGAVVRVLTAWILSKIPPSKNSNYQPSECRFDHQSLNQILVTQNANIAKMLEQNGKQIEALRDANHAAELRHQVVLSRLEKITDSLKS